MSQEENEFIQSIKNQDVRNILMAYRETRDPSLILLMLEKVGMKLEGVTAVVPKFVYFDVEPAAELGYIVDRRNYIYIGDIIIDGVAYRVKIYEDEIQLEIASSISIPITMK